MNLNRTLLATALATAIATATAEGPEPGGFIETYLNGRLVEITPNIVPAAMRSYLLSAGYAGAAQTTTWYIAPFENAVTPVDTLTAANFDAQLNEFTNYTEANRPQWVREPEANQAIANSVTLAKITCGAGGGTINGIALLSVNTKGAATGLLAAATRFANPRPLQEGDVLEFKYTMQMNLPA